MTKIEIKVKINKFYLEEKYVKKQKNLYLIMKLYVVVSMIKYSFILLL